MYRASPCFDTRYLARCRRLTPLHQDWSFLAHSMCARLAILVSGCEKAPAGCDLPCAILGISLIYLVASRRGFRGQRETWW